MGWELLRGQLGNLAAQGGASSLIQSIQSGSITLGAGVSSNTATISSVDTSKSILIWNGVQNTVAAQTQPERWATRIALTNGTTVTATRESTSSSSTVRFTVVEFASGVNSIQSGTIAIGVGSASNTATISAVGANAFVLYLGASTAVASAFNYSTGPGAVVLTDSTTVTASNFTGNTMTVGYMVVDLDSTIVTGVRQGSVTDASANTSYTGTITSVDTTRSLVFYNGVIPSASNLSFATAAATYVLTNGTTVTLTRSGTNTGSRTHYYTVVEFTAAALNSNVQRGTIAQSAASSNTATISSVNTAKSFVNWNNALGASANADTVMSTLTLTNATTVTSNTNSSGTVTTGYEVIEFK